LDKEDVGHMNAFLEGTGRSALIWVGLLITAISAYFALRGVHANEAWEALKSSNYWWLAPALGVLAIFVVIRALRWWYLFPPETRPPLRAVTEALLLSYLFNNILPARAGEVARVIALKQRSGTSRAESAATVVIERGYDVATLLVLLFVALPWLPAVTWLHAAVLLALALAVVLVAMVAALSVWGDRALALALRPLVRLPHLREQMESIISNLGLGVAGLRRSRTAFGALFWTTSSWLLLALSFWLATFAFDLGVSMLAGLFVVIAVGLGMILPASPGSLGVFEAATVLALSAYGVSRSVALSYALVLHLLNFLPYLVVGFLVLHRHARLTKGQAKQVLGAGET
jgi:glycosyltransferase 2 family protein